MNTEIADINGGTALGWVCYDADCPMCRRWAKRFESMLKRHHFEVIPLQTPAVRTYLKLPEEKLLEEMRVITRDGNVFGGADALVYLTKVVPGFRVLHVIASLPGVLPMLRVAYRWIARHRLCNGSVCDIPEETAGWSQGWLDALPLVALTVAAFVFGKNLPPWVLMWTICLALFCGCKWLKWRQALRDDQTPTVARALGFLFGWIGMDAKAFFNGNAKPVPPCIRDWSFAIGKILLGAVLVWGLTRKFYPHDLLLAGWTGMVGLILILHFGAFDLLALAWHRAGIDVTPLMLAPIRACSLTEFWGRRWNTGFHQLTEAYVFNPARRRMGPRGGLMFAFLVSGLVHDLVISVPARGGYGFPTIYFLIQGAGVLFERMPLARKWGMGRGWRGWLFTMIVTVGPAFWLFHPPFVRNVMIPFLQTLNAL